MVDGIGDGWHAALLATAVWKRHWMYRITLLDECVWFIRFISLFSEFLWRLWKTLIFLRCFCKGFEGTMTCSPLLILHLLSLIDEYFQMLVKDLCDFIHLKWVHTCCTRHSFKHFSSSISSWDKCHFYIITTLHQDQGFGHFTGMGFRGTNQSSTEHWNTRFLNEIIIRITKNNTKICWLH